MLERLWPESVIFDRDYKSWQLSLKWGGPNFCLTRAEGHPFLLVANPTNWATSPKDDTPVHTAKLKEGEKSTVCDSASNLGTPTSITIHWEGGWVGWLWWDGIFIGLAISGLRGNVLRCKGYPIIMGWMDIMVCVEGCIHMPKQRFVVIQQQERMECRKIRTSGAREPTNTSN